MGATIRGQRSVGACGRGVGRREQVCEQVHVLTSASGMGGNRGKLPRFQADM